MRLKPYLLPLVQFTLIGPGIGVLTALLLGSGGVPTLSGGGFFLLFGYGVGLAPAALAGAIYVHLERTASIEGFKHYRIRRSARCNLRPYCSSHDFRPHFWQPNTQVAHHLSHPDGCRCCVWLAGGKCSRRSVRMDQCQLNSAQRQQ